MRYRRLGHNGLRVSELCLGTMTFGGTAPPSEARAIFERYAEAGGNFLDTAVNYTGGASERIVGDLLKGDRDRFVLATKYSAPLRRGDPNSGGNHAKSLRQAMDTSLGRLGTDHIDLYWVHVWDGVTPLEETVGALDDAVRAGKVLHVGISNAPAWVVARGVTLAEASNRARFAAIQVEYNLAERAVERELVPMSDALGLGILAWGPLAGGLLSGKYLGGMPADGRLAEGDRRLTACNLSIAGEVVEVARSLGVPPSVAALAWLRARPSRPIPVLGARTATQLEEALGCLDVELPADLSERLDAASAISLGYPHDFLAGLRARYGG